MTSVAWLFYELFGCETCHKAALEHFFFTQEPFKPAQLLVLLSEEGYCSSHQTGRYDLPKAQQPSSLSGILRTNLRQLCSQLPVWLLHWETDKTKNRGRPGNVFNPQLAARENQEQHPCLPLPAQSEGTSYAMQRDNLTCLPANPCKKIEIDKAGKGKDAGCYRTGQATDIFPESLLVASCSQFTGQRLWRVREVMVTNNPFDSKIPTLSFTDFTPCFFQLVDDLDKEKAAQRKEFLKRCQAEKYASKLYQEKPLKPARTKSKLKLLTFEEKLERTYCWLKETFPHLFPDSAYIPLDILIMRDLKNDYKNNGIRNGYPQDLVIKAALSRYRQYVGYLECLKAGASRYNLAGEVCGRVTEEEEGEARRRLKAL